MVNEIEFVILGCLIKRNMSGYQIKHYLNTSTNFSNPISDSSIYPTLKKFKEKGYVTVNIKEKDGRLIKVYEVTANGKQTFLNWFDEPINRDISKSDMLNRIYFSEMTPDDKIIDIVAKYIEVINNELRFFEQLKNNKETLLTRNQLFSLTLVMERRVLYIKMYRKFLKDLKKSMSFETS